jgi:hypothetical protein
LTGKKIVVLTIFLLSLLAVGAVSAADNSTEDIVGTDDSTDIVIGEESDIDLSSPNINENPLKADVKSFSDLNQTINGNNDSEIYLDCDYKYSDGDDSFKEGIFINRSVTIIGNGITLDGSKHARIFKVGENDENGVVFKNITFINGLPENDNGGAIIADSSMSNVYAINCTFRDNKAIEGGAMKWGTAIGCTFQGNDAHRGGGIIYGTVIGCKFINNSADGAAFMGCYYYLCTFVGNGYINEYDLEGCKSFLNVSNLIWTPGFGGSKVNLVCEYKENQYALDNFNATVSLYKDGVWLNNYSVLTGEKWVADLQEGVYTFDLILNDFHNVNLTDLTLMVTDGTSFTDLNNTINGNANATIELNQNYTYNEATDEAFKKGIVINREVTINGNNFVLNANGNGRIFNVTSDKVTLKNITFKNGYAKSESKADSCGGAIFWSGSKMNIVDCKFINNTAEFGGANYFDGDVSNVNMTGNYYCNNTADNGGASFFGNVKNSIINETYIQNMAKDEGSANEIMVSESVVMAGKYINNTGRTLIEIKYSNKDNVITDSIFLNNDCVNLNIVNGDIHVINTWFGNNASNYNQIPQVKFLGNVKLDNWLFMNATVDPNVFSIFQTTNITFKLDAYNPNTKKVSGYNDACLQPIELTITSTSGGVDKSIAVLRESIKYSPSDVGKATVTAQVEKIKCGIELNILPPVDLSSDGQFVILNLPDDATGIVTLASGNDTYSFLVIPGCSKLYLNNLFIGNHNCTINYSGDGAYPSFTRFVELNNLIPTTITSSVVSTVYNGDKYLVATLNDGFGNPLVGVRLTVKLGTKTFTPSTDENGTVKVSTNNLAPVNIYSAEISFEGNEKYAPSTKTEYVLVKKATPKLTAAKKTFKKSTKTKKYTVTLKTNQNKVMKKVWVTLKVNKKTYKAKTNSNGKATFKITNLKKKGTFKATVTYGGNKYYNAVTKKNVKIIVK